ncbi:hypothetical protein FJZ28_05455 [Candidatus Peregrinibacteria bacterium]|nr:hypothetical protein [Candidatus Peregrinibacteria bacterium]
MSEMGGLDIGMPQEGGGSASEQLSEEAKQRFAAAAAAMQQIRREEKKAKKKDDKVAQIIMQFLSDQQNAHLFTLIARLVARDCPSIFILAMLSLIHEVSMQEVKEYLGETMGKTAEDMVNDAVRPGGSEIALTSGGELDAGTNHDIVVWITRMQMVLSREPEKILMKLLIDDRNIDGTVLQLATFILQRYCEQHRKSAEYENLQPLTASILQTVFGPFIGGVRKRLLEMSKKEVREEE